MNFWTNNNRNMAENIEKFDPSTLMQGVKDRIKATFVSLIPDEQWGQMVKAEIDSFFKQKETGFSNNRQYASDFQMLVRSMVNQEVKDRLEAYLKSPEFQVMWDSSGHPVASEAVKKLMIENSGAILANFYSGMFSSMLAGFASNINKNSY